MANCERDFESSYPSGMAQKKAKKNKSKKERVAVYRIQSGILSSTYNLVTLIRMNLKVDIPIFQHQLMKVLLDLKLRSRNHPRMTRITISKLITWKKSKQW